MASKISSLLQHKDPGGGNDLLSARQREKIGRWPVNLNTLGKGCLSTAAANRATYKYTWSVVRLKNVKPFSVSSMYSED